VQSSFFEMRRIAKETYPIFGIWPTSLFQQPYLSNARVLAALECPVLLVHGSMDPEVNSAHSQDLHRVAKSSKLVILPNTAHSEIDASDADLYVHKMREFINQAPVEPELVFAADHPLDKTKKS
jgi:alpha-beta hydrolase superfamily lysophospholipase